MHAFVTFRANVDLPAKSNKHYGGRVFTARLRAVRTVAQQQVGACYKSVACCQPTATCNGA